jgi:dUTPase
MKQSNVKYRLSSIITVRDAEGRRPCIDMPVSYADPGAACFDITSTEAATLAPGEVRVFKTGLFVARLKMEQDASEVFDEFQMVGSEKKFLEWFACVEFIPEIMIRPRSGLAAKRGVTVLNTPGCVDESYPGEIGVILINLGKEDFTVNVGDRIAQGCISLTVRAPGVMTLDAKRTGGFGSTGA